VEQLTRYRRADAGGMTVSYREAGPADAPVLLLLPGAESAA
jgi:hypothetical protein